MDSFKIRDFMEGGTMCPPYPKKHILKMPLYGHNPLIGWKIFFFAKFRQRKNNNFQNIFFSKNFFFWKIFQKNLKGGHIVPPPGPNRVKECFKYIIKCFYQFVFKFGQFLDSKLTYLLNYCWFCDFEPRKIAKMTSLWRHNCPKK